jgi:hypothetical protein
MVEQLRLMVRLSGGTLEMSPQVMTSDTMFSKEAQERGLLTRPYIVFTLDVPTEFSEGLLTHLREYIHAAYSAEFFEQRSLEYNVFTFELPTTLHEKLPAGCGWHSRL